MATLTLQDASKGVDLAFAAAAAGGDEIGQGNVSGGWHLPVVLVVRNAAVGAMTVTVAGMAPVNVAAGGAAVIPVRGGPYGAARAVAYSAVTSVTVAAARLTSPLE